MSIKSDFYPLHNSISTKKNNKNNKIDNYRNTHRYHTELLNKLHPEMYISSPKNNLQMIPGNYLSDRELCVVSSDGSDLGKASGCSITHKNMLERPKHDFIKKISDDSFASQIIPSNNNNNINEIPGIDLQNYYKVHDYETINSPMGELKEPHGLNSDDLYKDYCFNKYEDNFALPPSI